jgi:hypothetical protein
MNTTQPTFRSRLLGGGDFQAVAFLLGMLVWLAGTMTGAAARQLKN